MATVVDSGAPAAGPITGLGAWLTTADHKKIGRIYVALGLVFSLVAFTTAVLFGLERVDAVGKVLLNPSEANQVTSLFLDSLVFLALLPLWLGISLVVVPLQIGSRTLAFPRAAAASAWLFGLSALMVLGSYAANGGPAGGRSKYIDLYYIGMFGVVLSLIVGLVCVATTALTLRAPGITIARIPAFSFASIVTAAVLVLTLPVMLGNIVLALVNHRFGNVFGAEGGTTFDWIFRQPQVYVLAVPLIGFAAEVVPVFALARQRMRGVVRFSIAGVGVLGIGAWAQSSLSIESNIRTGVTFITVSVLIGLPVVAGFGVFGDTLRAGGKPVVSAPLAAGLGAMLLLLVGVGAGLVTGFSKLELVDTTWELGHLKLVAGASSLAVIGGLIYWAPKIWGKSIGKGMGLAAVGLTLIGTMASAIPDLISGVLDQPMLAIDYTARSGQELLNGISFVGEVLACLGGLVLLLSILKAARSLDTVAANPWNGHTLEWATSSPPSAANFGSLPMIASSEPMLDQSDALTAAAASVAKGA